MMGQRTINIMTACDDNYARLIFPQLVSIHENLGDYQVNFFLLHSRVSSETIANLTDYCDSLGMVKFWPILVDKNLEVFSLLASNGGNSMVNRTTAYPFESYFLLDCHNWLPNWVDRVLYIHTGDVVFLRDISEYYFSDFADKSLTVEAGANLVKDRADGQVVLYGEEDQGAFIERYKENGSYFNSGSFMINVERLRNLGRSLEYFLGVREKFMSILPESPTGKYYRGDQAFFAVAFLGEVHPFREPTGEELNYREYGYTPLALRSRVLRKLPEMVDPKIIHFDGMFKPWQLEPNFFSGGIPANVSEGNYFQEFHDFQLIVFQRFCAAYWSFAELSPVYNEMVNDATRFSGWMKATYLPLMRLDIKHRQRCVRLENRIRQINSKAAELQALAVRVA